VESDSRRRLTAHPHNWGQVRISSTRSTSGPDPIYRGWLVAAALTLASQPVFAQPDWRPVRPIEIVTGTSGGGADRMARLTQTLMQEKKLVPTPVTIVTKTGAGNSIAFSYLNQKPGDAHTLLVSTLSVSLNYLTGTSRLGFRDFTPVCTLFDEYVTLVVRADSPITSGGDLVERLRKDPAAVSIGITSAGGANHLAAAIVLKAAGIDVRKTRTVVFESAGKALLAVLGGHVDIAPTSASVPVPHLQAGTVRVIGITAPWRLSGIYSGVPTWREQGVDAEFSSYRGFSAPKNIAASAIAYWESVFGAIDGDPRWHAEAEQNLLARKFRRSGETQHYLGELETPLKAVLGDLGMLKQAQ
jgi:putative tricarboxylic transport membrane protein